MVIGKEETRNLESGASDFVLGPHALFSDPKVATLGATLGKNLESGESLAFRIRCPKACDYVQSPPSHHARLNLHSAPGSGKSLRGDLTLPAVKKWHAQWIHVLEYSR